MKRKLAILLISLSLAAGYFFVHKTFNNHFGDPDRYYHLALSRLMSETHAIFLRSVPQVEGLGWHENFVDKEFLFHQVTAFGYRIGGDRGVILAGLACSILAMLSLFWFAASRIALIPALAIAFVSFFNPLVLSRLMLLRPHTLAMLTFTAMIASILSRRPKLTAFATMIFVLSYHAFYMPIICFVWLALTATFFSKDEAEKKNWIRVCAFGAFGCVAGVLLNPYFPGNLVLGWIHARIPYLMKHELSHLPFGQELHPAVADDFLRLFIGPFAVMLASAIYLGSELRAPRRENEKSLVEIIFLGGTSALFMLMSFQILRASEYMVPTMGCLLVVLAERVQKWRKIEFAVLASMVVGQTASCVILLGDALKTPNLSRMTDTLEAVAAIPADARGAFVYNCEWDRTPYLMYSRPDLRFVDILDPSLLYFHDQAASRARDDLRAGLVADLHGFVHKAFKADYVLCEDPATNNQMRLDPGFELLYPKKASSLPLIQRGVAVFAVKKEVPPLFVDSFDFTQIKSATREGWTSITPDLKSSPIRSFDLAPTTFLNLEAAFGAKLKEDAKPYHCALMNPGKATQKHFLGAKYLGIGGGQEIRIWRNGKPLFHTLYSFARAQSTSALIPLATPLKEADRLDVLVCSEAKGAFWGVSMSFYKKEDIEKLCGHDSAPAPWEFREVRDELCFGPIAPAEGSANR